MNYGPLSVSRHVGIQYRMTQLSMSTIAALFDGTVVPSMAFVSFVCQSVKTSTSSSPDFIFPNELRMSIAKNFRGPAAGSISSCF